MGRSHHRRIHSNSRYVALLRLRVLLRYENAQQAHEKMPSQDAAKKTQ